MFTTIIVVLIDLFVVFLCLRLIMNFAGTSRIKYLNPFSLMFYKEFFVYGIIGTSLFLCGFGKNYYLFRIANDSTLQIKCWCIVLYCAIGVFGTLAFLNKVAGNVLSNYFGEFINTEVDERSDNNTQIWIWIFILFELVFYFYYSAKMGYIPIVNMFRLSGYELTALRYQDKFNYTGNSIIRNIAFFILPFLTSYSCYCLCNHDISSTTRKIQFYLSVIASVLCLTVRYEKSYLIYYFLGFLLLPKGKLKKSEIINSGNKRNTTIALAAISVFAIAYVTFVSGANEAISSIYRAIYSEIIGLFGHLRVFPDQQPFLKFQYYPDLIAGFFGNTEIRSSRIVMQALNNSIYAGHMNSLFAAEAYANGGWVGILFSPFIVGISIYITYWLFSKLGKNNVFSVSAAIYFAINTPITGGYLDFFYNPTLIIVLILALLVKHCYFSPGKY